MTHFCWLMGTSVGRSAMATRHTRSMTSAHGAFSQSLMGSRHLHLSVREEEEKPARLQEEPLFTPRSPTRGAHVSSRRTRKGTAMHQATPAGPLTV